MYHHALFFVIVSKNNTIQETLQKAAPLEDCDYTFQTVQSVQGAVIGEKRLDVAFIYDCTGEEGTFEKVPGYEECILMTVSGNAMLTDPATVSAVSEIWYMPEQDSDSRELLTIYFERLAKRMKQRADARKQKICFETLINSVPDISWFKETSGAHLIVNDSFCEMVGKTKEQIYKQGHCYIWGATKEDEEVCLNSDRIIMESRKTNTFEEMIKTQTDTRLLKSYKSALVDENGEIFGTCGIAHDMTELQNMSTELDIVLDSIPFAVLVENTHNIVLNKNSCFDMYFPKYADIVGKSSVEWKESLKKNILLNDRIMEVVVQGDEGEQWVLVFEEEPILDIFKKEIGRIVTLMDITIEWSISQQNEHTANTDYLTGLSNRRNLMHYLENLYALNDITLVMVDLDNFKHVNDTFGHNAGDKALVQTADILRECFPDQFVSRLGGDEFLVVVSGKEPEEVKQGSSRLLKTIRDDFGRQEEFAGVTASVGMVSMSALPEQQRNITDLLKMVDDLLYDAKKNGKNRCCIYGEEKKPGR